MRSKLIFGDAFNAVIVDRVSPSSGNVRNLSLSFSSSLNSLKR